MACIRWRRCRASIRCGSARSRPSYCRVAPSWGEPGGVQPLGAGVFWPIIFRWRTWPRMIFGTTRVFRPRRHSQSAPGGCAGQVCRRAWRATTPRWRWRGCCTSHPQLIAIPRRAQIAAPARQRRRRRAGVVGSGFAELDAMFDPAKVSGARYPDAGWAGIEGAKTLLAVCVADCCQHHTKRGSAARFQIDWASCLLDTCFAE